MSFDLFRLDELRAFLPAMRSRLQPRDVGLPETARRRVPGLRREEVAELLGVSSIWYRWFESGRNVRVSEQFIARLSTVLKLDATEEVTLYRLALPGLYRADRTMREQAFAFEQSLQAWSDTRKGAAADVSFGSRSQIQSAARDFAIAREQFLSEQRIVNDAMRPRVARSWARSQLMGVDAGCSVASYSVVHDDDLREKVEINERLLRASKHVTTFLAERLSDTGYAVVVTDAQGCLLRVSGDAPIQRRLSRLGFEPGGDWSERSAGTNAIGTAIADGRSLQLMGAEHYCDGWLGLTCTAAPIREASTSTTVGVLDVTADYRLVRPHLLGLITDCAMEIEEALSAIG